MSPKTKESTKINQIMAKAPKRYLVDNLHSLSITEFQRLIPNIIPSLIKEDIAYYFNYLKNNRTKKSLSQWEKETGCTDSPNSWKAKNYRPIFSFLYYDRITDGLFLPFLLKKIEAISTQNTEVTIEEFNSLCRLSIVGFRPKIDKIDLKILRALSNTPDMVAQTISDTIEHSYATVYNHLQKIKAKMGFRVTTRVNWAKLGVQRVFLISRNETLFEKFNKFKKYQDGQVSFLWGEVYHLRYYFLNIQKRENLIDELNKLSKQQKNEIEFLELSHSPISGYDFDLYDIKEQRWDFDFATAYNSQQSLQDKDSKSTNRLFIDTFPPDEVYSLTKMETDIIEGMVGNYDLPQKEIAKMIGIHAPNFSITKTKLQNDRIIIPQMMINTFLPLNLVLKIQTKNKKLFDVLIDLIQKMPYANISPVKTLTSNDIYQILCFLTTDDILYSSLVTFLMKLQKEKLILSFRLGLVIDQYFGITKVSDILETNE